MAVKRYNGTSWDTVAGLGAQGAAATSSSITTWVKTASGGETSLTGSSDSSTTLAYTPGQEQVFINGVLQVRGSDYTATNGTSITGLTALVAGDIATVTTVNAFSVTGAVPLSTVTANGDLIVGTSSGAVGRLGVGSTSQVLTVSGGVPTWATPSSTPPTNGAAYVGANESTTSTSFTDLATAGPAVTLTTGTKAFIILSSRMEGLSTSTRGYMGFAVSGATTLAANEGRAQELKVTADQFIDQKSFGYIVTGLTAGSNTFTAKYKSQTGSIVYYTERRLSVVDMGS